MNSVYISSSPSDKASFRQVEGTGSTPNTLLTLSAAALDLTFLGVGCLGERKHRTLGNI